jgi:hypothetical protein
MSNIFGGSMTSQSSNIVQTLVQTVKQVTLLISLQVVKQETPGGRDKNKSQSTKCTESNELSPVPVFPKSGPILYCFNAKNEDFIQKPLNSCKDCPFLKFRIKCYISEVGFMNFCPLKCALLHK